MSLSRKDDPRTWLVPGPRAVPRPPLHARLLYYELTKSQRALLRAMHEHAPEGALWEASLETYAETSGLSVRHIWNLIHGWERNGHRTPGLLDLKILEVKRKAKRGPLPDHRDETRRNAAYAFNEWALHLREGVLKGLKAGVQEQLPMEGTPGPGFRQPLPTFSATVAERSGNSCRNVQRISATVADDSRATTSTPSDSTPGGFLRSAPGGSNLPGKEAVRNLAERIGFVSTPSNLTALTGVIELTRKKHGFTYEQCCSYLEQCFNNARASGVAELQLKPYFFLVDLTFEIYRPDRYFPIPAPTPIVCEKCADRGWLHLAPAMPSVNGSRLIPCDCNPDGKPPFA